MRAAFITLLLLFEQFVLLYFLAINTSYLVCSVLAFFRLRQHRHRWTTRELEAVVQSPATPGVSVIAPAYNEQTTIVESMRSLLLLNYPQFEVVVVNDGSKDETLTRAIGRVRSRRGADGRRRGDHRRPRSAASIAR